ncbi:MAG: hypothetical protein AABZ10_15830 [Nitrospirota bacterium]
MKKFSVILAAVLSLCLVVSLAFAAESKKGTIKGIDEKAGTITFCTEGTTTDMTLKVDKSVDLKNVKKDSKAEVMIEKDTVMSIKAAGKKPVVGC